MAITPRDYNAIDSRTSSWQLPIPDGLPCLASRADFRWLYGEPHPALDASDLLWPDHEEEITPAEARPRVPAPEEHDFAPDGERLAVEALDIEHSRPGGAGEALPSCCCVVTHEFPVFP